MKESSAMVLLTEMDDSTNVGTVDDKRKKIPPDDHITSFDHNEILQNKNVQGKNEEDDNEEDNNKEGICLLGCADLAAFESKLDMHFITYFKQRDVDTRPCSLHNLNNVSNKRTFNAGMLRNIQQRLCCCVNDLITDEMEVDEFEEDELSNYNIE
eukprot:950446-Ditylum_brightwellii.AAC.1